MSERIDAFKYFHKGYLEHWQ